MESKLRKKIDGLEHGVLVRIVANFLEAEELRKIISENKIKEYMPESNKDHKSEFNNRIQDLIDPF